MAMRYLVRITRRRLACLVAICVLLTGGTGAGTLLVALPLAP
jgi:hypothetical protein